ncbi:hypothetical protein LCL87_07185 [Rhodococcus hoagii]|nr:hypothetical protein [Prescottella equi]
MTLRERRAEWFDLSEGWSAAFWVTVASAACGVLLAAGWWAWILLTVAGALVTYGWWRARCRGERRLWSATCCALLAAGALSAAGLEAFQTQTVRVDSVGQREIVCGSVVHPVSDDGSTVTDEWACADRLGRAAKAASGAALVGVLLSVRAVGHVVPRRPVSAV